MENKKIKHHMLNNIRFVCEFLQSLDQFENEVQLQFDHILQVEHLKHLHQQ